MSDKVFPVPHSFTRKGLTAKNVKQQNTDTKIVDIFINKH